jgi:hypothetical protein
VRAVGFHGGACPTLTVVHIAGLARAISANDRGKPLVDQGRAVLWLMMTGPDAGNWRG